MKQSLRTDIKHLRSALMSLPATGETGFEGLIGVTLREISGVPFRLAGGGSQFGVDGKPVYERDTICFEGKRYDNTVPRAEVFSKIAELSINNTETDIWVLGATSQITSQLADDARELGTKIGIVVLILDWSETDLPPLAVALAMGKKRVQEFLTNNISIDNTLRRVLAALEAVRNSQDFASHADRIFAQCNEPAVGWALAQRANTNWLTNVFSNRKLAKLEFGQPLSPGDTDTANVRQRKNLIDKLRPYLTAISDDTIICILGGEGNGKSWIVAQSWLILTHKPLMVFMSPDDFIETAGQNDVTDILIFKLIKQTGDRITPITRARWRRRLGQWRNRPLTDSPRLIAVIDGINQRPKCDWARIIERFGNELNQLGGRLIITARTPYFQNWVKGRLSVPLNKISVSEWTEPERDEILSRHNIKTSDLHNDVATSLCNPRLLGIALKLLDKADITNFEELSVSRLLFEHMRMSERDAPECQPVHVFAHRLQKHAQEIMSRVKAKQQEDLNIFKDGIEAVADGRFFQAVEGDPTRYSLKDDGLTLALGFAVLDQLRTAQRNNRNLDAELYSILEPIASLDDTADVIIAALIVIVVGGHYEKEFITPLIKGFASLQNPDQSKFLTFVGLAKRQPQGFMDATHKLCLEGGHLPNFDWIRSALIIAGRNRHTWQEMSDKVHFWLSVYSLSPDQGTVLRPAHHSHKEVQEEREKNRNKIEGKLQALSANERTILNDLPEEEGDLNRLSHLALLLLAGKPLARFARSLLNWSFLYSLNSDYSAPYMDFINLVSLNRVDWPETRAALLEVSAVLREADVSATGKWTLVHILRAIGHSDDGEEVRSLVKDLTKDWPQHKAWRLIENYCTTDPCDPASEEPENITRTAEHYAEIDVSKLRQSMGQTSEDLFFIKARTGVARFKPEVAASKHKEFAADVLNRIGFPLRQGLFELRQHNALLTPGDAREIVKKREEAINRGNANGLSERDAWLVSQYQLLIAFPFLNAREQAEILLSNEADEDILIDLMDLVKPLDEKEFENLLGTACDEANELKQYLLLELARHTSIQLSSYARTIIAALFQSESERVRAQAMGVITESGDVELLGQFAESDWKADTENENSFEAWYGSAALLEAAAMGLMAHDEVLDRISARLYGRAALILDEDVQCEIARRIDVSINKAANLNSVVAPDIELQVDPSAPYKPCRFSIGECISENKDIKELMREQSESNEAFQQRQRRNNDAFLEFEANLTQAKAKIISDHLSLEEFATVVGASEELTDRWYDLFMKIDEAKLPAVHNLVLLLAYALGSEAPSKAVELFNRVKDSKPLVRFTFGRTGVQLDAMATWAGARNPVLDNLRITRLDRMGTDHDLSIEVLAALINGQQELLTSYIEAKLRKEEPAEISRGIMVAGFSDQSIFNDKILNKYEGSAGLIGSAQKAAKYAYERNVWARHWFEKMCKTDKNTDFWRYTVLFLKIVDGRFAVWCSNYHPKGSIIQLFEPIVDGNLKNRFTKWENHRKKKLFGMDAPASIFLEGADFND